MACPFRGPAEFRPARRWARERAPPRRSRRRADACPAIGAGSDAARESNSPIQPELKSWPQESATRRGSSKFKVWKQSHRKAAENAKEEPSPLSELCVLCVFAV